MTNNKIPDKNPAALSRAAPKTTYNDIKEYVAGKSIKDIASAYKLDPASIIKLGSNENPYGTPPAAIAAIKESAEGVSIYPSVDCIELRKGLAEYTGYPAQNIVVGVGMDGVIDTLMRIFMTDTSEVIIPTPTFSYYEISTLANGGVPRFVKRNDDFSIDADSIIKAVQDNDNVKMIFLCSPNNPSGNLTDISDIERIAKSTSAIVFVDEAYIEFADDATQKSAAFLVKDYDNIVVGRTFSKAFGLAGMRIGYAIVPDWIFSLYMKAAAPFVLSNIAINAGIASLSDTGHFNKSVTTTAQQRKRFLQLSSSSPPSDLSSASSQLPCKVYPSQANFVLIDVSPLTAAYVSEELLKKGIIIRDCTSFRDAGDSLIRITVGTPAENDIVIAAFTQVIRESIQGTHETR